MAFFLLTIAKRKKMHLAPTRIRARAIFDTATRPRAPQNERAMRTLTTPNVFDNVSASVETSLPPIPRIPAPRSPVQIANTTPVPGSQCHDIETFLRLLHAPGDVFEVRIPKTPQRAGQTYKATAAGYFDNPAKAVSEIKKWERTAKPPGVYVTVNPVRPDLIARANNRIEWKAEATSSDPDIIRRRWMMLDIDSNRPAKVSATNDELDHAKLTSQEIRHWLTEQGWPQPLRGMSGNGAYLLYSIDLPNDDESAELVKRVLQALAARFNNEHAHVDVLVFNASRIVKVLGTMARKGDSIDVRPHRQSYFIVTDGEIQTVSHEQLEAIANLIPSAPKPPPANDPAVTGKMTIDDRAIARCRAYLAKMPPAIEGQNGSTQMLEAAATGARFGLSPPIFRSLLAEYSDRCEPPWSDAEIDHKLSDGYDKDRKSGEWGKRLTDDRYAVPDPMPNLSSVATTDPPVTATDSDSSTKPSALSDFLIEYPHKRRPIIKDLLRAGETMNIIGASKAGKSWLILGLLLAMAAGRVWLGRNLAKGRVLLIDNELHREELSSRIGRAMAAMEITNDDIGDRFDVLPLRGQLADIHTLATMMGGLASVGYAMIALDAFYRVLPEGVSENDNAQMASIYNKIDEIAGSLDCAIVLNHHASKGDQSGKAITDVGSGAGSISRAADTHLIVRPHELDGHAVLEGVCRSFAPVVPTTIRYDWPLWSVSDIEPKVKRPQQRDGSENAKRDQQSDDTVIEIFSTGPQTRWHVRKETGWGQARVDRTLQRLLDLKKITAVSETDPTTGEAVEKFAITRAAQ